MRSTHKTLLKTMLEAATYDGDNLAVEKNYINSAETYPYFFILSGEKNRSLIDNRTYSESFEYFINAVFEYVDGGTTDEAVEAQCDEIEELLTGILDDRDNVFRDQDTEWRSMNLVSVSSPFRGGSVTLQDNAILKSFRILITKDKSF